MLSCQIAVSDRKASGLKPLLQKTSRSVIGCMQFERERKQAEDPGGGIEIGWLCSFSLPIITLCAFIVLNIFISLLDFFLRWMMWIKICIPIPRSKSGG